MEKGTLFIISAPAGTGKTTLVQRLTQEVPHIVRNISYTTRAPRGNEVNGQDYHFVSHQEFHKMVQKEAFLEYEEVFSHFYGTAKKTVESLLEKGLDTILVIDTKGALKIKPHIKNVSIFLTPPSIDQLEERLRNRNTETEQAITERLAKAHEELEAMKQYDYHLVNEDLETTYQSLKAIFVAERLKKLSK